MTQKLVTNVVKVTESILTKNVNLVAFKIVNNVTPTETLVKAVYPDSAYGLEKKNLFPKILFAKLVNGTV